MVDLLQLSMACAAFVAPDTTMSIIHNESGGNPLAIHVNKLDKKLQPVAISSPQQAEEIAKYYISKGYTVDIGLMQVNSKNLHYFNVSIAQAIEPCNNINIGATILAANYKKASKSIGGGHPALLQALSAYNTGNFYDGFVNGYVSKYTNVVPVNMIVQAKRRNSFKKKGSKGKMTNKVKNKLILYY